MILCNVEEVTLNLVSRDLQLRFLIGLNDIYLRFFYFVLSVSLERDIRLNV